MTTALDKLRKNTTIESSDIASKSQFFEEKDMIQTFCPAINVALSGSFAGGFVPGFTMWAGPSKHFKTLFSLIMAKAYMDKYPDAALLYYDNEFGTPKTYFSSLQIDMGRILHTPILHLEQLKHDLITQLDGIVRGDKLIVVIDSIGNVSSKKELDDALSGSDKADMTRAKALKGMFRMATPYLNINDIPLVAVNHTYKTQEMYSKDVVSGGTGSYYSADNIFIVGREQNKEGTDIVGYDYKIRVEKSRFVREKSVIPITVNFDSGISKWSGLLDMATEAGVVVKPKQGWYNRVTTSTGEIEEKGWRRKDTDCEEFWKPLLNDEKFCGWVKTNYQLSGNLVHTDEAKAA